MCNTLSSLIKFEFNLIIFRKDNIVYILLVNKNMCLNVIKEPNI